MPHRNDLRSVGRPLGAIVLSFFGLVGQASALEAVYVSNFGSSSISAYTVDSATGALMPVGAPVPAGNTPFSITVSPNGKFAYVVDRDTNNVLAFTIDNATGALTPAGSAGAAGATPFSIAVSPNGAFAYVAYRDSDNVSVYAIDGTTGALSPVGSPVAAGTTPYSIAVSPNGAFAYVANYGSGDVSAYTVNSATGALTPVGSPVAAGTNPFSVAVSPNGAYAYVSNSGSGDVSTFSIDSATGALTPVGSPVAAGNGPGLITLSPSGAFAYVANSASGNISTFTVDNVTGTLTPTGSPVAAGTAPYSVAVSPSGAFAYAANSGSGDVSAYTINSATGALGPVSGSPFVSGANPFALTTANLPAVATAPIATTGAASGITATAATLNGTASANGAATTVNFEYGLTTAYGAAGSPATATQSPLSISASGAAVSAAISGLSCNTTYHYRVNANNGVGSTVNGSDTTFLTAPCVPNAPTAANATAGNAQATVTFTAPAGDGGGTITGYTVISNPPGGTDTNAGSTSTSHVITGLTNGTAYTFTVVASNSAGAGTPSAASNSVTPSAPASEPSPTPTPTPTPTTDPQPGISPLPGSGPNRAPVLDMSSGSGPQVLPGVVSLLSGQMQPPLQVLGQSGTGAVVLSDRAGVTLSFMPTAYQTGDSRPNGIYPLGTGQYHAVTNGASLTISPALVFFDQLQGLLPGAGVKLADNGVIMASVNGATYAVQPDVFVQGRAASGTAGLSYDSDGTLRFTDAQGNSQRLFAAFADVIALRSAALSVDSNARGQVELDGTVTLFLNGQRYTLVPDVTLGTIPAEKQGQLLWEDGPARYRIPVASPAGASQGFSVK